MESVTPKAGVSPVPAQVSILVEHIYNNYTVSHKGAFTGKGSARHNTLTEIIDLPQKTGSSRDDGGTRMKKSRRPQHNKKRKLDSKVVCQMKLEKEMCVCLFTHACLSVLVLQHV